MATRMIDWAHEDVRHSERRSTWRPTRRAFDAIRSIQSQSADIARGAHGEPRCVQRPWHGAATMVVTSTDSTRDSMCTRRPWCRSTARCGRCRSESVLGSDRFDSGPSLIIVCARTSIFFFFVCQQRELTITWKRFSRTWQLKIKGGPHHEIRLMTPYSCSAHRPVSNEQCHTDPESS